MHLSKQSGNLLLATGALHTIAGIVKYGSVLLEIAQHGFINTISESKDRTIAFWFLFSGFIVMLLGKLMQDFIRLNDGTLPAYIGHCLLALSVIGCLLMPVSGFWLVVPQALLIIYTSRK